MLVATKIKKSTLKYIKKTYLPLKKHKIANSNIVKRKKSKGKSQLKSLCLFFKIDLHNRMKPKCCRNNINMDIDYPEKPTANRTSQTKVIPHKILSDLKNSG